MSKLNDARAEILVALYGASGKNKIQWEFDPEQKSLKAKGIGDLEIHIDRSSVTNSAFRVWIIRGEESLDTFFSKEMREYVAPGMPNKDIEDLIDLMYNDVKDEEVVRAISPLLTELKSLQED